MASLQATFALGAPQRRSHVRLSPAKTIVLRPTSHLFRGRRVCSSSSSDASGIPCEGTSNGKAAAAAGLQALAVAAACAVGASVCVSRAAAACKLGASVCVSRAPAIGDVSQLWQPDSIPTETAPASAGEERRTSRAGKTPLLLDEIMFGRTEPGTECDDLCKKLVDHAFAILPLDDQIWLLEQISKLQISKDQITGIHIGNEEYELQIAIVQLYLAMVLKK